MPFIASFGDFQTSATRRQQGLGRVHSTLGELEVAAVVRIVGVAQDVQQPRAGGDQQPAGTVRGGGRPGRPPGRATLWWRGPDPALGRIRLIQALEGRRLSGQAAEGGGTGREAASSSSLPGSAASARRPWLRRPIVAKVRPRASDAYSEASGVATNSAGR